MRVSRRGRPNRYAVATEDGHTDRQTLPDSSIVLQSYVKDEDNTVRAIDYREQANRSSDEKKVLKERYGFFTK
jgi:hypothetical protein